MVLNKADYLSCQELGEALQFTSDVVNGAAGQRTRIYPVSARAALRGGTEGFTQFAAEFSSYLETGRPADVERSIALAGPSVRTLVVVGFIAGTLNYP